MSNLRAEPSGQRMSLAFAFRERGFGPGAAGSRPVLQAGATQQRLEEVVVRVVDGDVDLVASRVVPDAVLQQEVRVGAGCCAVARRGQGADGVEREREVALLGFARCVAL